MRVSSGRGIDRDMDQVTDAHCLEYETKPDVLVTAPGRFHLIGEHCWYFKDKTLSMAVNLPVYLAISVRNDSALRFYYPQLKERKRANISTLKYRREDRWANALKAIVFAFGECGFSCRGMNITVWSDILPSAGFGITTAIKVAMALAIRALFHPNCTDAQLLQIIDRGNRYFLNTGNFISDIYTAMYSQENSCILIDHSKNTYKAVPFDFKGYSIVLTDARVPRISLWNEDTVRIPENFLLLAELKNQKNGYWIYEESETEINDVLSAVSEETRRRLICIMKEHDCIMNAVPALESGNFQLFARMVNKSHEDMRDLFEISCPEIDWLAKRVLEFDPAATVRNPAACARITGKGFGRCLYTFMKTEDIDNYVQKLAEYERIFGFSASYYVVKPEKGAHVVECTVK